MAWSLFGSMKNSNVSFHSGSLELETCLVLWSMFGVPKSLTVTYGSGLYTKNRKKPIYKCEILGVEVWIWQPLWDIMIFKWGLYYATSDLRRIVHWQYSYTRFHEKKLAIISTTYLLENRYLHQSLSFPLVIPRPLIIETYKTWHRFLSTSNTW